MRFNICDHGAVSGTKELQTAAVQRAIDACRDAGGGTIVVPAGEWHIGSIRLYSHQTLLLEDGARLIGSADKNDYTYYGLSTSLGYVTDPGFIEFWNLPPYYTYGLITLHSAEDVEIRGEGDAVIDGSDCLDPDGEEKFRGPMGIVASQCRNIRFVGYTFQNSANWAHQIDASEDIVFRGIALRAGHDGIDLHHCKNALIEGVDFRTGDDCIAGYDNEHVVVRKCWFNTSCQSFRYGGHDLLVEDCVFYGPGIYPHRISGRHNTLAAFTYYSHQADPKQDTPSGDWVIRNCDFTGLDCLVIYRFGSEPDLQVRQPLTDVRFEHCNIGAMNRVSPFQATKEHPAKLSFVDCTFGPVGLPELGADRFADNEFVEITYQ